MSSKLTRAEKSVINKAAWAAQSHPPVNPRQGFPSAVFGARWVFDSQTFDCIEVTRYEPAGRPATIVGVWDACCPTCQCRFTQNARQGAYPARRCKSCRELRGPYRLNLRERRALR